MEGRERWMESGMIHIYCGDGKGKTTSATGLAVRAAGCGLKVLFVRFLKNENSGELRILDIIPEIEVMHMTKSFGFFKTLDAKEQEEARSAYAKLWDDAIRKIQEEPYDMLVMDEFMAAYQYGMIDHEAAVTFLKERPKGLEVVLTGRNPEPELLELADYISEITKRKHPFDQGIYARRGIEY